MARQKKTANGYYRKTFVYDGKRYVVYGKDQEELAEKLAQKREELKTKTADRENPTLNLYYEYITNIRRNEIKEATLRTQKYQFRMMANVELVNGKKFGEIRIREVTRRDIEAVRQSLLDEGKKPEYLNICFAHLNHVFSCALLDETIDKNPCRSLKPLKREEKPVAETKHRALTEDEAVQFMKAAEERQTYFLNCFKLMMLTGLRVGEVGALYLTDIDSEFIHVRRSITRDELGNYEVGKDTKTYSGKRDIPITPEIRQLIRGQRELNNIVFGLGWTGTLFKSPEGRLLREYTVNREINRICQKIGIEKFTCHGFRVTFATRFIEQRPQDYKILSEIMGHKDISITLNIYTRVMKENKVTAMNEIKIKTS